MVDKTWDYSYREGVTAISGASYELFSYGVKGGRGAGLDDVDSSHRAGSGPGHAAFGHLKCGAAVWQWDLLPRSAKR